MLTFQTKKYKCSSILEPACVPSLSQEREAVKVRSTIRDYEGLFIGYGTRETAYPYTEQNLYSEEQEQDVRTAVLENDFLYAEFLPDFGGRLWKLYDKKKQQDVLYTNDVIRFRNLSIRNAWFSGGVEWNCGIIGHTPFTCSPMYCAKVQGAAGQTVLRFYEFERVRSIYYQMDFWLEENRLMAAVRIENPSDTVVPMYWWSNMATPEYKGGRVAVPAQSAYNNSDGMGIKKSPIPFDSGVDVSYPANIPDTIDYFYDIDATRNKFIANVDENGYGLLQFSNNTLKGRKLFSWGHRKGSTHWQRMLTDQAGDYVEIQAGLGKTQYECLPMPPKTAWSFLECYTLAALGAEAVKGTYEELVNAADKQVEAIASSHQMDLICAQAQQDIALQSGEIVYEGSGFGYLENYLAQTAPAHLEFRNGEDAKPWLDFFETGVITQAPMSYAYGSAMETKLRQAKECQNWNVPYQLALLHYDRREFEQAKALCEQSMVLDNNYSNNHLYATVLYQLGQPFTYFANKCLMLKGDCYGVCESIFRLFLKGEAYQELIQAFDGITPELKQLPRLNMYLSMAYLMIGDAAKAECILMKNGGLKLLDFREGDRFLDTLYRGIRVKLYGESYHEIIVPELFDFIVSKQII